MRTLVRVQGGFPQVFEYARVVGPDPVVVDRLPTDLELSGLRLPHAGILSPPVLENNVICPRIYRH